MGELCAEQTNRQRTLRLCTLRYENAKRQRTLGLRTLPSPRDEV